MLAACLLTEIKNTTAGELTLGLQKRLSLAMALIGDAKLVILSNPLVGVDLVSKNKLLHTIIRYTRGRSLIMSSRDVQVA